MAIFGVLEYSPNLVHAAAQVRACLADGGNILWDCINVLTADTKRRIQELGGIQAIAISHPHFYTGMANWAAAFDAPIYIHELDKHWVTQSSDRIQHWTGALSAAPW